MDDKRDFEVKVKLKLVKDGVKTKEKIHGTVVGYLDVGKPRGYFYLEMDEDDHWNFLDISDYVTHVKIPNTYLDEWIGVDVILNTETIELHEVGNIVTFHLNYDR